MPSNATQSGEIIVNTDMTTAKSRPSVAMLQDGGWIVSWNSEDQDGSLTGIYQQRYDSLGEKVGKEKRVNITTADYQYTPKATGLDDGGWVVTWSSFAQDGDRTGVFLQRYDANGKRVGGEEQVNTHTTDDQIGGGITSLSNGGWLVVWASDEQDGSGIGVYQQRYDADAAPQGEETRISASPAGDQSGPSATMLGDGGWVVSWTSPEGDANQTGIYQQMFDKDGVAVGEESHVNTTASGLQLLSTTAALADGGWIVTWEDWSGIDGSATGVFQQRFDATGAADGGETLVNTTTANSQAQATVTVLADGGWVVCWSDSSQAGVKVNQQRYDADGEKVGDETLITTMAAGNYPNSSVTAFDNGGWVVTWQSTQPGVRSIFQSHFAADIDGGKAADTLAGTGWGERISGLGGRDTLLGGGGQDVLVGGGARDTFAFRDGDTAKTLAGADTIEDFNIEQRDRIDLSAIDANTKLAKNNAFDFIGGKAFHKEAGELRAEKIDGDTYVFGDTNGNGKADFVIHLDGLSKLTAESFVL